MNKKTIIVILIIALLALAAYWYFVYFIKTPAPQSGLTQAQARVIAEQTCIKGGESLAPGYYNENSKTWWFDANLNATQPGCNPACVVSEQTKTAEVNWRCTGANPPGDGTDAGAITNFADCAAAGNPVMESYPRQCRANGQTFTEQINKEISCTEEQRKAEVCSQIYDPVCAVVEIQCIKAPCNPVKQTFANACEACGNPLVKSYTLGQCEGEKKDCSADCPMFAPPPAGWCADGKILPALKDDCGCLGPARCSRASQAIKQLLIEKYPNYAKTLSISIEQETDNYARGSVSFEPGAPGGIFLAAKIDGAWQIVHEGNGEIPCSLVKYGFPGEMLKDCAE